MKVWYLGTFVFHTLCPLFMKSILKVKGYLDTLATYDVCRSPSIRGNTAILSILIWW